MNDKFLLITKFHVIILNKRQNYIWDQPQIYTCPQISFEIDKSNYAMSFSYDRPMNWLIK